MVADFLLRTAMAELTGACARTGDPLHLYPPFLAHQHRFAPVTLVSASLWLAVARSARPRVCRAAMSPCALASSRPSYSSAALGTSGPPRCGEAAGGNLTASKLTGGENRSVDSDLCSVSLTRGAG